MQRKLSFGLAVLLATGLLLAACSVDSTDVNKDKLLFTGNPPEMRMAWIEPGSFMMGVSEEEIIAGDPGLAPQHKVTLTRGFYMGIFPVTQKQWKEVMGEDYRYYSEDLPVVNVSWYEAVEFCNRLSIWEGLEPAYIISNITQYTGFSRNSWSADVTMVAGANGYRLPTEAEWEYACRAGTTTLWNTGDSITVEQANFNHEWARWANSKRGPLTNVGSYAPNAWGLYDMHGNVDEWYQDIYNQYGYSLEGADTIQMRLDYVNKFQAMHESYRSKLKVYSDTVTWERYYDFMDSFFSLSPNVAYEYTKIKESEFGGIPDSLYHDFVAERDALRESSYNDLYKPITERVDPIGPATGDARGARGGTWFLEDYHISSAYRSYGRVPAGRSDFTGFRVVRYE